VRGVVEHAAATSRGSREPIADRDGNDTGMSWTYGVTTSTMKSVPGNAASTLQSQSPTALTGIPSISTMSAKAKFGTTRWRITVARPTES